MFVPEREAGSFAAVAGDAEGLEAGDFRENMELELDSILDANPKENPDEAEFSAEARVSSTS